MLKFLVVSDMCGHDGSYKTLGTFSDRMEISCSICGLQESYPIKNLSFEQVKSDTCLRMVGFDFSPYLQPKPEESNT